jgi:uncharacterized protein (TIGR03437 family)
VTIAGTNLSGATSVTFGGTGATITANSATSITVITPAHVNGTFDVVVTTPGGTATAPGAFTFSDSIPTLSGWMLILLAATLAGIVFVRLQA